MTPTQPIKYIIVGLSGVAVNMAVLIPLKEYLLIPVLIANVAAISVSILTNFILNDKWTFADVKARKPFHYRLSSFVTVSLGGMILNTAIFGVLVLLGIYYILASCIAIGGVFLWNYTANKRVTWCSG